MQVKTVQYKSRKARTMRILGKTLTSDEMLLTAEGAAGVGMGLGMMFDPKKAHVRPTDVYVPSGLPVHVLLDE